MSDSPQTAAENAASESALTVQSDQKAWKPEESHMLVPVESVGLSQMGFGEALRRMDQVKGHSMLLLLSLADRAETDVRELREEKKTLSAESTSWMKLYYEQKEEAAVLRQQISALTQHKNTQKFMEAIGGIVAGVGIPFIIQGGSALGWGWASTGVGLALLIAGFLPHKTKDKK